jgi:hypothetical protein
MRMGYQMTIMRYFQILCSANGGRILMSAGRTVGAASRQPGLFLNDEFKD